MHEINGVPAVALLEEENTSEKMHLIISMADCEYHEQRDIFKLNLRKTECTNKWMFIKHEHELIEVNRGRDAADLSKILRYG